MALGWFLLFGANFLPATTPSMRPFDIDLPHHVLKFSLPTEITQKMSSLQVNKRFDPSDPSDPAFLRDKFIDLVSKSYQFDGPFWVGTYGWFQFSFSVVKRVPEASEDISTIEGLDRYVRWWSNNPPSDFNFDRSSLAGTTWLRRQKNTFGCEPKNDEQEDTEIFSIPLDKKMFLQVVFRISESVPGSAPKWKPQAEAFREAIKTTIVLQPKAKPLQTSHTIQ